MIKPIKEEIKETKKELKERTITLLLAGFGFVAALAWNEAVKNLFDVILPKGSDLIGKFLYALLVTVVVVVLSLQLQKISEKKEQQ